MHQYEHKVGALFADPASAAQTARQLRESGFESARIRVINPPEPGAEARPAADRETERALEPEGEEVPAEVARNTLTGAAAGAGAGTAGAAGLAAAGATLVVSAPVLAGLTIAGYAAAIGGAAGAIRALHFRDSVFDSAIADAVAGGRSAVVTHCRSSEERDSAQAILHARVSEQIIEA